MNREQLIDAVANELEANYGKARADVIAAVLAAHEAEPTDSPLNAALAELRSREVAPDLFRSDASEAVDVWIAHGLAVEDAET